MPGIVLNALHLINISFNLHSNNMNLVFLSHPLYKASTHFSFFYQILFQISSSSINLSNHSFIQQTDVQFVVLGGGNTMVNKIKKLTPLEFPVEESDSYIITCDKV